MIHRSLIKNYIYNLIKTLCSVAFPLITVAYTSRVLGVDGLGKINFSKSFVTYFSMIAMLGINQYGTREAAKVRDDKRAFSKFVHEILIINFVATLVAYLLLAVAIFSVKKLQDYQTLLWINSFSIAMSGLGMEWLYQAVEEYAYIAKRAVLFQIIALAAMFLFVHDRNDVVLYAMIVVFSSSGSYIINFIHARKYVEFKPIGHYELKKHLAPMLWLFAMAVSIEVYTVLDTTMLGFICTDTAVGLYNAAIKVNKMIMSLITAVGVVLIPRLSCYIGMKDNEKMYNLVRKGYNYIFLLSIPAAIGLFVLSDDIMLLFSGSEFASAGFTMRIMTWIVIVISFSVMTNLQILVPMGKEKLILLSTCVGAVVNVICNAIFIPRFAENGAAIGTVVAETAVAVVCLFNASRLLDLKSIFKGYYQYWIAALPIFLIAFLIKRLELNYVIEMIAIMGMSGLCYAGILYAFKNEYLIYAVQVILKKMCKK